MRWHMRFGALARPPHPPSSPQLSYFGTYAKLNRHAPEFPSRIILPFDARGRLTKVQTARSMSRPLLRLITQPR